MDKLGYHSSLFTFHQTQITTCTSKNMGRIYSNWLAGIIEWIQLDSVDSQKQFENCQVYVNSTFNGGKTLKWLINTCAYQVQVVMWLEPLNLSYITTLALQFIHRMNSGEHLPKVHPIIIQCKIYLVPMRIVEWEWGIICTQ